MRLLLVKICAITAVNLVAGGAHAEAPNVMTKSAHVFQLHRDIKNSRTHRSTQDNEEERGINVADAVGEAMKSYLSGLLTSSGLSDNAVKSTLESRHVTDLFTQFYTNQVSVDEVYRAMEIYGKDVTVAVRDAYMRFFNEKTFNNYLSLAEPVKLTLAEPVHPTLAEPVLTRSKGKGPAEVVGVQLASKILSDQYQDRMWWNFGLHPANVLILLKLDDDFLGEMYIWIKYVEHYNKKHKEESTTVYAALKKGGIKEETLINLVFSWNLREESVINMAKNDKNFPSGENGQELMKTLIDCREKIRTEILNGLHESWQNQAYTVDHVRDILGLSPTLRTGFDLARLLEWVKYVKWAKPIGGPRAAKAVTVFPLLIQDKTYTWKQLEQFVPEHSNDIKFSLSKQLEALLGKQLNEYLHNRKEQ